MRALVAALGLALVAGCSTDSTRKMYWVIGKVELFTCSKYVVAGSCSSAEVAGFLAPDGTLEFPSAAMDSVSEFNGRYCFVLGEHSISLLAAENGFPVGTKLLLQSGETALPDSDDYLAIRCEADEP